MKVELRRIYAIRLVDRVAGGHPAGFEPSRHLIAPYLEPARHEDACDKGHYAEEGCGQHFTEGGEERSVAAIFQITEDSDAKG